MTLQWMVCSFNFYLLFFIAGSFEKGFKTALGVGIADMFSNTIGALLVHCLGARRTLILTKALPTIGGLVMLFYGLGH